MKKLLLLFASIAFFAMGNLAQTVTDYDGNNYSPVTIGSQVWLDQNLKVTHFNNGTPIPNISGSSTWSNLKTGARCYYNNDSTAFDSIYGALYNWYAVNDPSGICPEGWHVPTQAEWQTLETFLGGVAVAGGKLKEEGTVHWTNPNVGATNGSGFTGLPGGLREALGDFRAIRENGIWWTNSQYNTSMAWSLYFWNQMEGVDHNPTPKGYGLSIRCIRNLSSATGNIHSKPEISLFPNPAKDRMTIFIASQKNTPCKYITSWESVSCKWNLSRQPTKLTFNPC